MRALPAAVRGPVLNPPCSRQRFLPIIGGFWHAVPRRVRAPQLWLWRSGPKHGWGTLLRLLFAMSKSPPHLGFHYTPLLAAVRGFMNRCHVPVLINKGKDSIRSKDILRGISTALTFKFLPTSKRVLGDEHLNYLFDLCFNLILRFSWTMVDGRWFILGQT